MYAMSNACGRYGEICDKKKNVDDRSQGGEVGGREEDEISCTAS